MTIKAVFGMLVDQYKTCIHYCDEAEKRNDIQEMEYYDGMTTGLLEAIQALAGTAVLSSDSDVRTTMESL